MVKSISIFNPINRKKARFPESATRGAQVADSTTSSQRLGKVKSETEYKRLNFDLYVRSDTE